MTGRPARAGPSSLGGLRAQIDRVESEHVDGVAPQDAFEFGRRHLRGDALDDLVGVGPRRVLMRVVDLEDHLVETDRVAVDDASVPVRVVCTGGRFTVVRSVGVSGYTCSVTMVPGGTPVA